MGRQTNRSLPKVKVIFSMRVWWFSTKGSPNQEMMQVCFPHYFSYVLLFFFRQFSPQQKKGKDEYETCISLATAGFRCCFLFSERPWPHSKINWLSSWSNWKSIRRFSASWCVPKPMKWGNLRDFCRKTLGRFKSEKDFHLFGRFENWKKKHLEGD